MFDHIRSRLTASDRLGFLVPLLVAAGALSAVPLTLVDLGRPELLAHRAARPAAVEIVTAHAAKPAAVEIVTAPTAPASLDLCADEPAGELVLWLAEPSDEHAVPSTDCL